MPPAIDEHRVTFAEQGVFPLGMVSPVDSYWVRPHTCTLVHGLHEPERTHWFQDKSEPLEIFAILTSCLHYQSVGFSQEVIAGLAMQRLALTHMRVLFPDFTIPELAPLPNVDLTTRGNL